jgi:hypothetical protein
MSKQNSTICQLCQKVLGDKEKQSSQCAAWCGDETVNKVLQADKQVGK